jgi:hypothetical protein
MESIVHKPLAPALASRRIRFARVSFYGLLTQLDTLAMQVSSRPGRSGSKAGTRWSLRERLWERCRERASVNSSGTETYGAKGGTYGRPYCC